jgi:hypothetical protein
MDFCQILVRKLRQLAHKVDVALVFVLIVHKYLSDGHHAFVGRLGHPEDVDGPKVVLLAGLYEYQTAEVAH